MNKWQHLAKLCRARRAYSAYHNVPYDSVNEEMVVQSSAGLDGWAETTITVAAMAMVKAKAKPKPGTTKPKANAKAGASKKGSLECDSSDPEKNARNLLSAFQVQENAMNRIANFIVDRPDEFKWAQGDLEKYMEVKKMYVDLVENSPFRVLYEDFKAAVYSPPALRALKKNNENYLDDMKQFVMQAVPHVDKMQGIVTCIQSTASARNLEELVTPMKGSKTAAASARKRASESGSASSSKVPKAA